MTTRPSSPRVTGGALLAVAVAAATLLSLSNAADAAIVPTVPLASAQNYAVLGASTVTNTGNSTLDGSLGLWPGGSVTGFPPGLVLPPGSVNLSDGMAQDAQSDLTVAYVDAAGRPVTATTTADLANLNLQAGVYAGPGKSPLSLTGPLVLDGAGDFNSVFVFQTDSTLITGSGSTVSLINGAQECNVFWQVGSSATLGTGSVFTGNILALTSITVDNSVVVHGRALARNGAVTLDNDTFTKPTCASPPAATTTVAPGTTTTTPTAGTTTTVASDTTGSFTPAAGGRGPGATAGASAGGSASGTTAGATPGAATSTGLTRTGTGLTSGGPGGGGPGGPDVPSVVGPPRTGAGPSEGGGGPWPAVLLGGLGAGAAGAVRQRRRRPDGARPDGGDR